ncbi:MAG TPA: hypothetical protein VED16_03635 [Candidatus Acidoferrum sp.]|nr:hypothetical protein [Candidatus Acidoferrum sp.]
MTTKEDIERLIESCNIVKSGAIELSKGIEEFEDSVDKQPIFVKPFVKRDFASNTGMTEEEWKRFAERLRIRFTSIEDDSRKVLETYKQQRSEGDTYAAIKKLKGTAMPFIDNGIVAIKAIEGFATYLESVPKKIKMAPKQFLKEEEKKKLIEAIPENVEKVKDLANLLRTIKDQLADIPAS